jgi:predicted nuclease of restriction endonuclease-like (RecB) superfamily
MRKQKASSKLTASTQPLLDDLRELITVARQDVAHTVNSALVILYWNVGRRIRQDILKGKRAGYGEQIVHALSAQLAVEFGGGFGRRNLFNLVRFAEIKQELRALREEDRLTPDLIFRDPYLLDFLGLKDTYSEKDIETAIWRELENFFLDLGAGFTFVARQKRITVDNEDFHLDLLFYNRKLRRMVAVELKLDKFKPVDKGQMELYLRWLEKYEQEPGEESPIGLILCASKRKSRSSCCS